VSLSDVEVKKVILVLTLLYKLAYPACFAISVFKKKVIFVNIK